MSNGGPPAGTDGEVGSAALFRVVETHDVGDHHLRVLEPDVDGWLACVAAEYRRLRTASRWPSESISFEGLDVVGVSEIERMLVEACVPHYEPGNFGVARSDLAEVIMGLINEASYGCRYGYRSVRDRELTQRPGRGIDQIGVEARRLAGSVQLTLVLGEAKASSEGKAPPQVVDSGSESLRAQHLGHLAERDETWAKVMNASRHADDPAVQGLLRAAAYMLRRADPGL